MSKMRAAIGIASLVLTGACVAPDEFVSVESVDQRVESSSRDFAPDRVIVRHWQSNEEALRSGVSPIYRGKVLSLIHELDSKTALYRIPTAADPVMVVEELAATGAFAVIELDYRLSIQSTNSPPVNDPHFNLQWHLKRIRAERAWAFGNGLNVKVAVLDTGCSEDPNGNGDGLEFVGSQYDYVNNDANASDDHGHGTHVAAIVSQHSNNGIGTAGLAYGATIMPIKVLDAQGVGYYSTLISGINFAVNQGADVINMSLSGPNPSQALEDAIDHAWQTEGVFLTCSAGNDSQASLNYPAAYENCVAVSATNYNDGLAGYSNYSDSTNNTERVAIAAPGGDITTDGNGDGYADGVLQESFLSSNSAWGYHFAEGTSMSAPQVAAVAAMLIADGATNTQALHCIQLNAQDLNNSDYFGAGLLRADWALQSWRDDDCATPACHVKDETCTSDDDCCTGNCRTNKKKCR